MGVSHQAGSAMTSLLVIEGKTTEAMLLIADPELEG
jgi:hypothetical protein